MIDWRAFAFQEGERVHFWHWNEDTQAPVKLELKAYGWAFHVVDDNGYNNPKVYAYHELYEDAQDCITGEVQKAKVALMVAQDRINYLNLIRERF